LPIKNYKRVFQFVEVVIQNITIFFTSDSKNGIFDDVINTSVYYSTLQYVTT